MLKIIPLFIVTNLLGQLLIAQTSPSDTLFPVFHHNYLIERHTDLLQFADEMIAYADYWDVARDLQSEVHHFKSQVTALKVWESDNVIQTNYQLNTLLNSGAALQEKLLSAVEPRLHPPTSLKQWINLVLVAITLVIALYYSYWRQA